MNQQRTSGLTRRRFVAATGGGHGWLNQPLLQLPWMNYVPEALRELATP